MNWVQHLPGGLLRPLALLPFGLTRQAFIVLCNQVFAAPLRAGELEFLAGRVLRIELRDAGLVLRLSASNRRLRDPGAAGAADVCISGNVYAFLLLVSRREDPDTLFFQRHLRIQGDTQLGLYVKNFLDAWEPPAAVYRLQEGIATLLERFGR